MTLTFHITGTVAIASAFLFVSCTALLVQSWWFHKITRVGAPRAGFHRTAACRVACAVIYVMVGVNAIWGRHAVASVSLSAFLITQLTWMANGGMDARDAKRHQASQETTDAVLVHHNVRQCSPRTVPGDAVR